MKFRKTLNQSSRIPLLFSLVLLLSASAFVTIKDSPKQLAAGGLDEYTAVGYPGGLADAGSAGSEMFVGTGRSIRPFYSRNLVGYWDFDEGTGNFAEDQSGNDLTAYFQAGMSEEDWVDGKFGSGLKFDPTYVNTFQYASLGTTRARGGIEFDSAGNYYVAGDFSNSVDFDFGSGEEFKISNGGLDAFVAKYNSADELLWVRTWGGTGDDSINRAAVDSDGAIYLASTFQETANFDDPGETDSHVSAGGIDIAIVKYNSDGSYAYSLVVGNANNDVVVGIDLDSADNLYYAGRYFGASVDLDPTAGVDLKDNNGNNDSFVTKINSDGSYGWSHVWGGNSIDTPTDLVVNPDEGVFILSRYRNTVDFDDTGAIDEFTSSALNKTDAALTKFAFEGAYEWTVVFGGTEDDDTASIATDSDSNVYLTGQFGSLNVDFDPGAGAAVHSSNGSTDFYISKFDSEGIFQWVRPAGGPGLDKPGDIYIKEGLLYVSGSFEETVDFDPGPGTDARTSNGGSDIFVTKYDTDGSYHWVYTMGGPGEDESRGVGTTGDNTLMFIGYFQDKVDFDDAGGTSELTSMDGTDGFVSIYKNPISLDYLAVPDTTNSPLDITKKITLSAWVFYNGKGDTQNNAKIIVKPVSGSDPFVLYSLGLDDGPAGSQRWRFEISDGTLGSLEFVESSSTVVNGVWTHVVGTYDGNKLRIFVNGKLKGQKKAKLTIGENNNELEFGRSSFLESSDYWNGIIDEVQIFNRALPPGKIRALYRWVPGGH